MHFPPSAKHGARLVATSSCAIPPLDVLSFRLQEPQVDPMAQLASFPRTIRCCKGGLALSPFPLKNLQPRTAVHMSHTFKGAPPQVHPIHRAAASGPILWKCSLLGGGVKRVSFPFATSKLSQRGWVGLPGATKVSREIQGGQGMRPAFSAERKLTPGCRPRRTPAFHGS